MTCVHAHKHTCIHTLTHTQANLEKNESGIHVSVWRDVANLRKSRDHDVLYLTQLLMQVRKSVNTQVKDKL